ncbi:tyrosine-type recombinase/integrase [Nitratifractor salsuginis]|uniref:Integrase family protein n=1 Tax=Nitratifractor salsuginis (strain DSM 16511 / JCM 12458 / E9I37-1) TaxID=749222 RepID=E6WZ16_NITSE|nr:tyrosine-type recombinase/integrase [Nitratifractor salsuginis]ADV45466.1 integrase family protein [Nitratifractor salsuginis DSM 16511]
MEEYVDDFLDYLFRIRGYSERTVATYELPLRQMLQYHRLKREGKQLILDIMPLRRRIASNTPRTVAKKLSAVRSFVRYLQDQRNLSILLEGDESVKVPRTLPKPIEERYIREVLEAADPTERLILGLLYGMGLRISELAGLRREQIDREWIRIHGKGGKTRQLPLPQAVLQMLDHYLALHPAGVYLFEKGKAPLSAAQIRYRVQKLFRSRGIKATPHQLRHSFATHLLDHGARISDVSELLGHASMATTQIYTQLGSSRKLREYMKAHPLGNEELGMRSEEPSD